MTEKIFEHISEKDTSGMDMKITDTEITGRDGLQTYLFEFGDNGTIHSAAFRGRLGKVETDRLFEFLHTKLYRDCPEAVRSYLERQHLEYAGFNTGRDSMSHDSIMERTEMLLSCCSCDMVDTHTGSADYYYGIMDYQKWLDENRCEGCHNPITWDKEGGLPFDKAAEDELFEALNKPFIDGITFSGGDPMMSYNRDEIIRLVKKCRSEFPNKTIWLYTGLLWDDIKDVKGIELVDVVAEGRFVEALKDNNLKWVGSSNQRVIDVKKTLDTGSVVLHI